MRRRAEKWLAFEENDDFSLAVFFYASADARSSWKTLRAVRNRYLGKKDTFRAKK